MIKSGLLLLLIWFYAMLTGFSPSVLRATTMFSFIIIGKSFNRHTNIYNTLAASCFLLLVYDPYLVMDVGFQLSYLAVLGIVFLQSKIYRLLEPTSWLPDQMWKITSVSIAAQLATFPLGLFYFHQFPNYFLLSNLIVIPVSTLVLYFGMLLFAVSKIKLIASFTATVLKYLIYCLNGSVRVMEHLPYAVIQGISISRAETLLIYVLEIFILFFFIYNRINYLRYFLFAFVLLVYMQCVEAFYQRSQKSFVVYDVAGCSAYDFIEGRLHVLLADSLLINDERNINFHIRNNWWVLGLTKHEMLNKGIHGSNNGVLFIRDNYIQFCDKRIVLISTALDDTNNKKIKIDYLVLSCNANCTISDLVLRYDFHWLIIDSSNSRSKADKWLSEAQKMKICCHSVIHLGAFQGDI